jgi:hypothetical protein
MLFLQHSVASRLPAHEPLSLGCPSLLHLQGPQEWKPRFMVPIVHQRDASRHCGYAQCTVTAMVQATCSRTTSQVSPYLEPLFFCNSLPRIFATGNSQWSLQCPRVLSLITVEGLRRGILAMWRITSLVKRVLRSQPVDVLQAPKASYQTGY